MKIKKMLLLVIACILVIGLAGCGGNKENKKESEEVKTTAEKKEPKYQFKNNVVEMEDISIKITKVKIIKVGEKGNEYGKKPVIAFWYKTTNKTDKEIDPMTAWHAAFNAYQDNNPNAMNEINMTACPDERFIDSQMEVIKKNGTVENAVAYELDDLKTPVTLKAHKGYSGDFLGEKEYKIKQK